MCGDIGRLANRFETAYTGGGREPPRFSSLNEVVSNDDFSPSMMLGVFYIHPKDSLTTIELMDKMHAFRMALTPDTQENDKTLSIGLSFANSNKS